MNHFSTKSLEHEAPSSSAPRDETFDTVVLHLIPQPETLYILGGLVVFTNAALENSSLVQLPIVVPHRNNPVGLFYRCEAVVYSYILSPFAECNSNRIVDVGLWQLQQLHPGILGHIAMSLIHWNV